VLGAGFADARISADAGLSAAYERTVEVYYNIEVAPWLHITPDVQWVANPGGDCTVHNAVVVGVRAHIDL